MGRTGAPSEAQLDIVPGAAARERRAPQSTAAHAVEVLGQVKARMSRAATYARVASVEQLPPARPVGRGEGRPPLLLMHTAAAPASLLLPGEWMRRFTSDESALRWAEREGWTVALVASGAVRRAP